MQCKKLAETSPLHPVLAHLMQKCKFKLLGGTKTFLGVTATSGSACNVF